MDLSEQVTVLGAGALAIALLLMTLATPLTRALEGYYVWPKSFRQWLIGRQRERWENLWGPVDQLDDSNVHELWSRLERINRFPRQAELILPTRLGNALRAGETYGWIQYGINLPGLWVHFISVADSRIVDALQQSRAQVDLHIAFVWLSLATSILALVVAVCVRSWLYLMITVVAWILAFLAYRGATAAVTWYAKSMWALVDTSRAALAQALGVRLPGDSAEETKIWKAIGDYATWGPGWGETEGWIARIDQALQERGCQCQPSP
jgi:hypothetical protein